MQRIKHTDDFEYVSPIFYDLERLYTDLSDPKYCNKRPKGLFDMPYDKCFAPIVKEFAKRSGMDIPTFQYFDKTFNKLKLPSMDSKNIIVCYSGGKDSFSVIRHYQAMGYNVYAYHIRGLNKTYNDEWKVAERMADELGVPIYTDWVSYSGNHVWIEHPMKNMIMASMALSWGIKSGISTKIACGTFRTALLNDVAFEVCAGDCIDMWRLFEIVVKRIMPSFQMYIPNNNYQTAYRQLLKEPKYLPLTISCLTPNRFRELFRKRTEKNYAVNLMPNRCGCCWKCAAEYIWFCDHGVLDYNKDYYIHCLEVLLNTLEQETGYSVYDVNTVWTNYFFYSMKKSKAYKELQNAFIRSRKIKIAH